MYTSFEAQALKFPILDVHSEHTAVIWGKHNSSQVQGPGELLLTALPCLRHPGNPMLYSQAALHFGSLHLQYIVPVSKTTQIRSAASRAAQTFLMAAGQ